MDAHMNARKMQIGVAKPSLGGRWRIPRSHGLVEHACISVKRHQIATIIRPSPRTKKADLCIWALEGPYMHNVVHSKPVNHHEGADDIYIHSIAYIDFFESWAVFQVPAVCHLFRAYDLSPSSELPIVMHSREVVCWSFCHSRKELVIGSFDSRITILSLSKESVMKKPDEFSLSFLEVPECVICLFSDCS